MKKICIAAAFLLFGMTTFAQGLQSPEQFMGYKIGTRYTRHHRIVEYFRSVAQARPDMVKFEKYGETNEGRELVLAYISSAENIQRLESIRTNNLGLAGIANAKGSVDNAPAIVWLSYNVHGNETSSSEAALMTLWSLVDPNNTQTKEYLKNTVVVIDPCINPDGRDRYVNWFNGVVGVHYNPDPASREHTEPWPGGRTNHYNFDLNRDWAWQTQVETQQRIKKYNQWLPQVHVDFHEQGVDNPYYFAPAADPVHEVVTQWQKDFQVLIGRNNAGYFDKNGWLYFTKELFDLLYPSYGDTYPLYNGAIGMTFEQAGGPRGGLGVVNGIGDTLTLLDRATHHYTTGLSTIETASRNKKKLMDEFRKYFDDAKSGKIGEYKTYVLTSKDENKIRSVIDLLEKNGIEYGTVNNRSFRGFNYTTGKDDAFSDEGYSLAVSAYQPKSVLAKVLFEPKTVVTDSNTYDITAWSLPYAYGIKGYAVKEKIDIAPWKSGTAVTEVNAAYGLLIPYQSLNASKLLAHLLKNNIKVRFCQKPFTYQGKVYDRGTLIILRSSNPSNWNSVANEACKKFNIQATAVETGFMDKGADFGSSDVRSISGAFKVAMLTGEQTSSGGAGEIWHFFEKQLDYPITLINAADLGRANLKNYQVFILPDGNYRSLNDKTTTDKLKDFVRSGGKLIAIDGAVATMANGDWGIKQHEDKSEDKSEYANVKKYADRETSGLSSSLPGAIYKLELDNTHPLGFGYPDYYYTLKQDAGVYDFLKDGWNVGIMRKDAYVTGFIGNKIKSKVKDGVVFGVQDMGQGNVIYFAEDPLFRNFWENGKMIFCNAVFLVGQ
ncbi:zinc carboxypeptidase [Sediminibacterium roseum]|uniref:Zinc carboxypeptidase n=1 Tax=Sediminibacterium roseum TaxID=1978412 RepID=A0ABW9ZU15_9BACT|nr:M14 metallopeptidase family protein [Sediminibacterium roseum]NCI49759.1 zinc carboxypeptidase [Sediminibacterium roseum]